jgi:hypothetical protein
MFASRGFDGSGVCCTELLKLTRHTLRKLIVFELAQLADEASSNMMKVCKCGKLIAQTRRTTI